MTQHITPKQLNELSEKGKKRLVDWYKNTYTMYDAIRFLLSVIDKED